MAKFTFKNIAADSDAEVFNNVAINPTLTYDAAHDIAYEGAIEDLKIKATDARLPVFAYGFTKLVLIPVGETFTVEPTDAAEVAFYTNLANALKDSKVIKATIVSGGNPAVVSA